LSLSLGGPAPLDETLLHKIRRLLDEHGIRYYSEHLSFCSDDGHLYDLMPIPFTQEAIDWVVPRIRRAQDILGRRIAVENVSSYATPGQEISEVEFTNAVLKAADCELLLDVNNVYVNSVNHRYDAAEFIKALPGERVAYIHIAGHYNEAADLIVDSHGAAVIDPVWDLLDLAYAQFGVIPTLLERDFNIPQLAELVDELDRIRSIQQRHGAAEPLHVRSALAWRGAGAHARTAVRLHRAHPRSGKADSASRHRRPAHGDLPGSRLQQYGKFHFFKLSRYSQFIH